MIAVGTPTEAQTNAITELLLVSSGLERICIQMGNFIDEMIELENKDLSFSDNGERELRHSLEAIIELFKASLEVLKDGDDVSIVMVIALRERLIDMEKEMQDNHLERLNSGVCNPKMTPYFNSILGDLTNIGTYCLDICQSLSYGLNVSVEER
jgi:phosphate:Na+ symporter